MIESNQREASSKIYSDDKDLEIDGLEARKVLLKQVVAAWHTDERYFFLVFRFFPVYFVTPYYTGALPTTRTSSWQLRLQQHQNIEHVEN
jgi:hypothetical protein